MTLTDKPLVERGVRYAPLRGYRTRIVTSSKGCTAQ